MRTFKLMREKDISGVSGTGFVAEGCEFENGHVVLHWLSQFDSINIYANLTTLEKVHSHNGSTKVVFDA